MVSWTEQSRIGGATRSYRQRLGEEASPWFDDLRARCRSDGRDALRRVRRRSSKERSKLAKRSLSPESAKSVDQSGKKKPGDVRRRTRGSASLPAPAERFGPIISLTHTNDLALTRNGGRLWSVLFRTLLGQLWWSLRSTALEDRNF